MRADAERNRERVLHAARDVFAEQGLDASTNEIARRAGVGVATLFRRFPTRDDLVGAVFADKMAAYVEAIDESREGSQSDDAQTRLPQLTAGQSLDRHITKRFDPAWRHHQGAALAQHLL